MLRGAIPLSLSGIGLLLAGAAPFHGSPPRAGTILSVEEVLEKTRALYPTLTSYADSGTVTAELTGFSNRARFRTYFVNKPRNYFFEYSATASEYTSGTRIPLKDRIVLWMFKGQLQSWNSALGTVDEYPEGTNQVTPFITAGSGTYGSAILVPSLIYRRRGSSPRSRNLATSPARGSSRSGTGVATSSWGSRARCTPAGR